MAALTHDYTDDVSFDAVDPKSGDRNMAIPSKPMLVYRKGLSPDNLECSCFGCNAVAAGSGTVSVGDAVSVDDWEDV